MVWRTGHTMNMSHDDRVPVDQSIADGKADRRGVGASLGGKALLEDLRVR